MVKNWNVSQMLPVPFTKWHFQISPHFHPFTVRCYFPYVSKQCFITLPKGKHILMKEVAGIFFFLGGWISIFLPAIGVFFQITCTLIILSLLSVSEEKTGQELPKSFCSGYRRWWTPGRGGPEPSFTSAPWRPWSDQAQCSQIISFTFHSFTLHCEVHVWNLHKISLNRVDSALFHRLS